MIYLYSLPLFTLGSIPLRSSFVANFTFFIIKLKFIISKEVETEQNCCQ